MSDDRVLIETDRETGIARITLNNPERRNSYDPAMREQLGRYLEDLALDDDITVVLLRGEGGVFSTGADMGNAYAWYGDKAKAPEEGTAPVRRRPSQRRRLSVDRKTFDFYHYFLGYPKVTVAEVNGFALGGGFELALMADISVVGSSTQVGMPATRFLGPALGDAPHVLLPPRPEPGPTDVADRRHDPGLGPRPPLGVHRGGRRRLGAGPGRLVGPQGVADAG